MKKAKLFLVGAAMLLAAGGAVAFKAHAKSNPTLSFCVAGNVCGLPSTYSDQGSGTRVFPTTPIYKGTGTCGSPDCPLVDPNITPVYAND